MTWQAYNSRTRHSPYSRGYPSPYIQPTNIVGAGGSGLLLPPVPSQLHAWYDFSDLNTLFQNQAGTTPVTGAGQDVAYYANKMGAAPDLVSLSASPPYPQLVAGPLGGTFAVEIDISLPSATGAGGGFNSNTTGLCMAIAMRVTTLGTLPNTLFAYDHISWSVDDTIPDYVINAARTHETGGGLLVLLDGGVDVATNDYIAGYYSSNPALGSPAGDGFRYLAPGPGAALIDALDGIILDVAAGTITIAAFAGVWVVELLELLLYFRHLVPSEQALLATYFDTKFGALPHA